MDTEPVTDVDKVAEAICEAAEGSGAYQQSSITDYYRKLAQAAIEALDLFKVYSPLNVTQGQGSGNYYCEPNWDEGWYVDKNEAEHKAEEDGLPLGESWVSSWMLTPVAELGQTGAE